MKYFYRFLLTTSLFLLLFSQVAFAQSTQIAEPPGSADPGMPIEDSMIAPDRIIPPSNTSVNPLGQDHSYSITLRGNGEAIVDFKTVFSNFGENVMSELEFQKQDGITLSELIAFQVVRQPRCVQYAPFPLRTQYEETNPSEPNCIAYSSPDFYSYWGTDNEFIRLEPVVEGSTIRIPLANPVESNSAGSILLSYRTSDGISSALLGSYKYEFTTLQVNDKINTIQIGISTDADLVLKGAESQVNYRTAPAVATLESSDMAIGAKSQQLSTFYQEIGYGQLNKNASNLQPNESFTVTGSYAESTFQLYGSEIGIGLMVFAVILGLISISIIILIRKLNTGASSKETASTKGRTGLLNGPNILILSLTSFITSLVLALVLAILIGLSQVLQYSIPWQYMQLLSAFYLLLGAALSLALLVIPGLIVGYKRGLWLGISTFVATIFWLILYFILAILFMILFAPKDPYGGLIMFRGFDAGMQSGAKGSGMIEPAVEPMIESVPGESSMQDQ